MINRIIVSFLYGSLTVFSHIFPYISLAFFLFSSLYFFHLFATRGAYAPQSQPASTETKTALDVAVVDTRNLNHRIGLEIADRLIYRSPDNSQGLLNTIVTNVWPRRARSASNELGSYHRLAHGDSPCLCSSASLLQLTVRCEYTPGNC